jgi:ABC-2 type transport system permease protein
MIFLGLRPPTDPVVWAAFGLCLLLGHGVIFMFDWLFSCVAFYTTETWGWQMLRSGFSQFFSGKLIPIAIFPPVLFFIANALPFAQTIYVPASVLSGITPIHDVPRVVAIQVAWLVGLAWASRLLFTIALRKVTVQGG